MTDLKNPKLIYLKGFLFLAILLASIALILTEHFSWKTLTLLCLITWSSARLYYFMFYVIEKYVDPTYKFAGILSFITYTAKRKN